MDNHVLTVHPDVDARGNDHLRLLTEVSEAIATERDLTTLCRELARRLPAIVPFELIALFLHEPERNLLRVHMLGDLDGDRIPPGLEIPVDASFSGLALTTQQPVVVNSRDEAARFPLAASIVRDIGVESFCMLPLTTTLRRLGVMAFGSSRPRAFDDAELASLALVVKQVAVAVDNVLHDQTSYWVKRMLFFMPGVIVTDVPYRLFDETDAGESAMPDQESRTAS